MTQQDINKLKSDIAVLTSWMNQRKKEQLKYPLDFSSQKAIRRSEGYLKGPILCKDPTLNGPLFMTDNLSFGFGVKIPGQFTKFIIDESLPTERTIFTDNYLLNACVPLREFSANPATDTLTSGGHNLPDGTRIAVAAFSSGLPGGLSETGIYYMVNTTQDTFQLSLTQGGAVIDITSTETGQSYFGII